MNFIRDKGGDQRQHNTVVISLHVFSFYWRPQTHVRIVIVFKFLTMTVRRSTLFIAVNSFVVVHCTDFRSVLLRRYLFFFKRLILFVRKVRLSSSKLLPFRSDMNIKNTKSKNVKRTVPVRVSNGIALRTLYGVPPIIYLISYGIVRFARLADLRLRLSFRQLRWRNTGHGIRAHTDNVSGRTTMAYHN